MRVISGKYKGYNLFEFPGQNIRPTADRTKESIFNILQSIIGNSRCLDLFCGSGSLGIEALSRGAREVVFVDHSKDSVNLTKKNLAKVGEGSSVILCDALLYLKNAKGVFDVIFIDPPYADDVSEKAVTMIFEKKLLADNGIIVFERDVEYSNSCEFAGVFSVRKYGKAVISFIRNKKECLFAGSFDPITSGHCQIIKQCKRSYDVVHVVAMINDNKNSLFTMDERLEMISKIYADDKSVLARSWDGLLVDYLKENNIKHVVRGIRNDADLAYEKEMEVYNKTLCENIVYDYIYSDTAISSSMVRERLASGYGVGDLVPKEIVELVECKKRNEG